MRTFDVRQQRAGGFTIIELVTIITVLGILAGIVVFTAGQWRKQTAETEVKNDLKTFSAAMENARNFQNAYPATVPSSFAASKNVTVTIKTSSTTAYCAEGTSKTITSVLFSIRNADTEPKAGAC
jgi:type II secretory pathway pseudopilin PulG